MSAQAITAGRVDLIPARFSKIPLLMRDGLIPIDVAFLQVTPPNENGYCSFGLGVDVARRVMKQAGFVVAEINEDIPFTLGDTFVHIDEFDMRVKAQVPPFYVPRYPVNRVFDKIAENAASVIDDGSCVAFSYGPIYEALARHLAKKKTWVFTPRFSRMRSWSLPKAGRSPTGKRDCTRGGLRPPMPWAPKSLWHGSTKTPWWSSRGLIKY